MLIGPLAWMSGTCLATAVIITAASQGAWHPELLIGMFGPLLSACGTWIAIERAYAAGPERVTNVLLGGFVAQFVFFGAWVVMALRVLEARPVPFAVSFTGYFLALHVMEAVFLKRLLSNDLR